MGPNKLPVYSRVGDIQWNEAVLAANTTKDLISGTIYLVFTADATNGGRVEELRFAPKGTNIDTIARIWINNGATTATAANNNLHKEVTLPATTLDEAVIMATIVAQLALALPPGYRVYVTLPTGVAAGFHVSAVGGKY